MSAPDSGTGSGDVQAHDRLVAALNDDVRAVLVAIAGSAVEELRLERGDMQIILRREWEPAESSDAGAAGSDLGAAPELPPAPLRTEVRAALVGVFHRAALADGPMLASEGDHVDNGRVVGVIEALGIVNDVEAPAAGTLAVFLVQDGEAVEYGEPLAEIVED